MSVTRSMLHILSHTTLHILSHTYYEVMSHVIVVTCMHNDITDMIICVQVDSV